MGATTIKPGQETFVFVEMVMHPGMEGPHHFRMQLPFSVDGAAQPPLVFNIKAIFG